MYVCLCMGISDSKIKEMIEEGHSLGKIQKSCAVGTSCGACISELKKIAAEKQS